MTEARANFEKARLALEMGKGRLATTLLESSLAIEADHPEYLSLWGLAQTHVGGDLKAARQACERAVASRSYDATLHAQLGCVLAACGHRDEAQRCFETALQQDPHQKMARAQLTLLQKAASGMSLRAFLRRLRR